MFIQFVSAHMEEEEEEEFMIYTAARPGFWKHVHQNPTFDNVSDKRRH